MEGTWRIAISGCVTFQFVTFRPASLHFNSTLKQEPYLPTASKMSSDVIRQQVAQWQDSKTMLRANA